MRYDSPRREADDFQAAVDNWDRALAIDPNQYIWRRRIQQYGPRLIKPYPFYGWVATARREIAARGETPIELRVPLSGAEIARPSRQLDHENTRDMSNTDAAEAATSPDPEGRIDRDTLDLIQAEVTIVPSEIKPGGVARVHVTLLPNVTKRAHWNNESEPLRVWTDAPDGTCLYLRQDRFTWHASPSHSITVPSCTSSLSPKQTTQKIL